MTFYQEEDDLVIVDVTPSWPHVLYRHVARFLDDDCCFISLHAVDRSARETGVFCSA